MKELLELIDVVNKHKVKHLEVFGNVSPRKTKIHEFYDKLSDGSFSNDEEAAAFFYETSPDDRRYKELKKRLVERLYNTVLFIDVQDDKYDKVAKVYYTCWKEYASAKVLAGRTAYLTAFPLMEKILKQAIRFGFMELILDICRTLRLHYGAHYLDAKKFDYYNDLYQDYKKRYEADALSEEYYTTILIKFYQAQAQGEDLEAYFQQAEHYTAELEPLVAQYPSSYRLHLCYYLIQLTAATSIGKVDLALDTCEKAIAFFQDQPTFPSRALTIFSNQLFLLYWQKRDFSKGEVLFTQSLKTSIAGSITWFNSYDFFFLLSFHTKQYPKAYETLDFILNHTRFSSLPENSREKWKLYQAYCAYLGEMGKIKIPDQKKFKVAKFINEVPLYASEKRTRNIPVLIIQTLFLFLHQRYDDAIDRVDSLNLYCSRYLKKDASFRSNCFIKMLIKIIEANFHPVAASRKASGLCKKLNTVPLDVAKQIYEIEIIPYEDLWELALESLDTQVSSLSK